MSSDLTARFLRAGLFLLFVRILISLIDGSYLIFFSADDIFADSIKSGLAQTSVSRPLLDDPRVAEWPATFQRYLYKNDYLNPDFSIRHSTPAGLLTLMGVAWMLRFISPLTVIGLLMAIYAGGAWLVARALCKWGGFRSLPQIMLPLLISYPALFMINRANFLSGYTSVCVILHLGACAFRQAKWAGWVSLALAINLRPNVAIFALMELWREERRIDAIRNILIIGAIAGVIAAASLVLANRIDPFYTLHSWLEALELYRQNYVVGLAGIGWNAALENLGKVARLAAGVTPLYLPAVAGASLALGIVLGVCVLSLVWTRRLTPPRLTFALAALCSHFTPVLAEYHVLVYAAPFLLLLIAGGSALTDVRLPRAIILVFCLQLLAITYHHSPSFAMLLCLAGGSLAFPWLVRRIAVHAEAEQDNSTDSVLILSCLVELSAIGDEYSQGIVISLVGVSTLMWLLAKTLLARQANFR